MYNLQCKQEVVTAKNELQLQVVSLLLEQLLMLCTIHIYVLNFTSGLLHLKIGMASHSGCYGRFCLLQHTPVYYNRMHLKFTELYCRSSEHCWAVVEQVLQLLAVDMFNYLQLTMFAVF
jgi:hypothetical protein